MSMMDLLPDRFLDKISPFCPHGHEFTPENTTRRNTGRPTSVPKEFCKRGHRIDDNPIVHKSGKRQCLVCVSANRRASYARRKTL